jgi:heme-degrading monooxygenase HmoA
VITECALLDVRPGEEAQFEAAFGQARPLIAVQPGISSLRLERCVEDRGRYLLLVEWERLEDHTEGFRKSAEYEEWRELLHRFYEPFPTVQHFEPLPV